MDKDGPITILDCGCRAFEFNDGYNIEIKFCEMHATAPDQVIYLTNSLIALTPGGSEYHDSPQRCLDWIKDRMAMTDKIAAERNRLRGQVDDLLAACEALVNDAMNSLNQGYEYVIDITTLKDLQALIAKAHGEE